MGSIKDRNGRDLTEAGNFPGGSDGKHLPAIWETSVQSLGQKDPLEKEWHPTPVLLPGKSHGGRSLGRLQSMGSQRVGHD